MTTQPTEYSPSWPRCTGVWKRKTLGVILLVALTLAENALAHCSLTLSGPSAVCVGQKATYTASVSGSCGACDYSWTGATAKWPGAGHQYLDDLRHEDGQCQRQLPVLRGMVSARPGQQDHHGGRGDH